MSAQHSASVRRPAVSDEELLAMKPLKQRKKATFDAPTPSNFCHICSRTPSRGIRLAICSGLQLGQCRKVVCERCFSDHALGCSFDEAKATFKDWKCAHCSGSCPERAQCRTYQTVNKKLRLQRLRQAAETPSVPEGQQENVILSSIVTYGQSKRPKTSGSPAVSLSPSGKKVSFRGSRAPNNISHVNTTQVSPSSVGHALGGGGSVTLVGNVNAASVIAALKQNAARSTAPTSSSLRVISCHLCHRQSSASDATCFKACSANQKTSCIEIVCDVCCRADESVRASLSEAAKRNTHWNCPHCEASCPAHSMCHDDSFETARLPLLPPLEPVYPRRGHVGMTSLKSRLLAGATDHKTSE
jgi:hypothetical protein